MAGVTLDKSGNLYGTTLWGGSGLYCNGCGTVYRLSRGPSEWFLTTLHDFNGIPPDADYGDGAYPISRVIFGPDGTLYGTTYYGGEVGEGGVVYNLTLPRSNLCGTGYCRWTETLSHRFSHKEDGWDPGGGDLLFDKQGNIYGTTVSSTTRRAYWGTVFKMTRTADGWSEKVIYGFPPNGDEGVTPNSGVIFGPDGNLYGTTSLGGDLGCDSGGEGCGTVYRLSRVGDNWVNSVVYRFHGTTDGAYPFGGLVFDHDGNLYGTTTHGGAGSGGTVFMLEPQGDSWAFHLIWSLDRPVGEAFHPGPASSLVIDRDGSVIGSTVADGPYGAGTVFKLTKTDTGWKYTSLYDFCAEGGWCEIDGYYAGNVAMNAAGNLYGTTTYGGKYFAGVVWEITP
jgi:uncharacterized repeat protein (TIGR03803 family)